MNPAGDTFRIATSAEAAVDYLAELHARATTALNQALKRYVTSRTEPSLQERSLFRYPQLRLTYECHGEVPASTRAYAKVQAPGVYSVTVTHPAAFRAYLLDQLKPLIQDFNVTVEVGMSDRNIPYPYVIEQGDELAGTGVTAAELARQAPAVIRGNASEVLAVAGEAGATRGVDSTQSSEASLEAARRLASNLGTVVAVTGKTDYVTDGSRVLAVDNGHPLMSRVTGMGCTASALVGAFLAVEPDAVLAAARALAVLGLAGELAAEQSKGPGSLQLHLLDALYTLDEATVRARARVR